MVINPIVGVYIPIIGIFLGFGTFRLPFLPPPPAASKSALHRSPGPWNDAQAGGRIQPSSRVLGTLERRPCVKDLSEKIRCEGFNDVFGVGLTILQCEGLVLMYLGWVFDSPLLDG